MITFFYIITTVLLHLKWSHKQYYVIGKGQKYHLKDFGH